MKRLLSLLFSLVIMTAAAEACTNFLVTPGAAADSSSMITYSADSHTLYGELIYLPAARHIEGTLINVYDWDSGSYLGQIKQVAETYAVVGNMNEHQLAIGETTFGGRPELHNPKGGLDYGSLMYFALQRARNAREAIRVMTSLVEEYGYCSGGESFSISDPREVWILEMIGKGEGKPGALWVARRVPDGYICGHANQARIRQFPLNDPQNCLFGRDVISFAREKGYFSGADKEFSFADTYAPLDFGAQRFCEARVWAGFRRAAPSLQLPGDYARGVPGSEPFPLWIKPDKKLTVRDVMELMRDHYEGTELDMTKDVGAGPYSLPYRWRPMTWKVDSVTYIHERATSTQQTGFSFVAQSRASLPDPIGGILWFGVDDTYCTVYVPMYCGINRIPRSFAVGAGSFDAFSWDSAFWVFNFVSNYTYSRYSDMIKEVQIVQRELEGQFIAQVPQIDRAALALYKTSPWQARDYLSDFSVGAGELTVARWKKLGEFLIWKFLDGNLRDEDGGVKHPPYPEAWYRTIADQTGDRYKEIPWPKK
ncbi:MAG TPA: C69 family dipeptidase [bacterium]|nr:C69 family dipeptidase [bacterium]